MKNLSLIHMTTAISLIPKIDEGNSQLELVATYLAPAGVLVKAKADPAVMEPFISQAAELGAEEAAGIMADFLKQFNAYLQGLGGHAKAITEAEKTLPGA